MSAMEESNQLPLKRVELSLSKFNEVAIPHHLDLLRQHKANIIKFEELGQYGRVRAEQTHARRVAAQLRALLAELAALRRRVRAQDRARFDARTQRSRDLTLRAIVDYLGIIESSCRALVSAGSSRLRTETSPLSMNRRARSEEEAAAAGVAGSAASTDSVGVVAHARADPGLQIQLLVDDHELGLREREEVLRGWTELQAEVRALHDAWQTVQAAALAQHDQVASVATNIEETDVNVQAARADLALAERLKGGAAGAVGAVAGALVGGPVGLVVGAKAGAAALLVGSVLGYWGGRVFGTRPAAPSPPPPPPPPKERGKDL